MLWQAIIDNPEGIANEYEAFGSENAKGLSMSSTKFASQFNEDRDPAKLLYLLARC